ncbi:hypothetical protein ACHAXT_008475 [Thalassiosira profunda]
MLLTYLEFYSGIGGWGHALEGACRSIAAAAPQNHPQHQHAVMANGEAISTKKHKISLQNDGYDDDSNADLPPPILRPELLAAFDHSDLANSVFIHNHIDTSRAPSSETSSQPPKKKRGGRKKMGPVRQTPIERLSLSELQAYDADVWCMSPPCQPHTRQHGNQQREKDDPRSKSFLHLCDVLGAMEDEKLPALLLLENVVGFEQSGVGCEDDGEGGETAASTDEDDDIGSFQTWRRALFRRNYKVAHFHLDPIHVGLPNVRPRHYTVAFRPGGLQRRLREKNASNTQLQLPSPKDGSHGCLFCKESLDTPPIIHDEKSLLAAGEPLPAVPCVGTFLDADLPPRATPDANPSKLTALQIPEKVRTSSSAWCFDIVTPDHRRSACFTHSYGKFIRGTGSILYYGPQMPKEGAALDDGEARCNATIGTYPNNATDETTEGASGNPQEDRFALAPPEERAFDALWSKELDWDLHVRYLSGTEIARLMGFPADADAATTATDDAKERRRTFGFPPGCSTKQQWKLLGNSLNVRVAATVAEIGLRSLLREGISPKWIVRPARPEDREAVERCLAASYSELLCGDYSPEVLSQSLPAMTTARPELLACPTWYIALHPATEEVVGCGGWTKHVPNKPEELQPHLRHFATDPKFTRSGIGRALWARTWDDVCDALGPETRLEAYSTLTAVQFYESLGFREVERKGVCFGGCQPVDFPCVLMERVP